MLDYEWILTVFGLVVVVSLSKIMQPVRVLAAKIHPLIGEWLGCPMCFGFWAGGIINLLGYSHYGGYGSYSILFDSLLASGTSYILHGLTWRITTLDKRPF